MAAKAERVKRETTTHKATIDIVENIDYGMYLCQSVASGTAGDKPVTIDLAGGTVVMTIGKWREPGSRQFTIDLIEALKLIDDQLNPTPDEAARRELWRAQARKEREREGEIEIDEHALISDGNDGGAYVAAWLWVDDDDAGVVRPSDDAPEDDERSRAE